MKSGDRSLYRHFSGGSSVVMFGGGMKKGFLWRTNRSPHRRKGREGTQRLRFNM